MDNRDLKINNPRCYGSGGLSTGDPHSPYLSHWRATYSALDGYGIDIEAGPYGDVFLQWDWSESEVGGDNWKEDYLPDAGDLAPDPDPFPLERWGMRGCAVGITNSGDYMVAGTARLDEERKLILPSDDN